MLLLLAYMHKAGCTIMRPSLSWKPFLWRNTLVCDKGHLDLLMIGVEIYKSFASFENSLDTLFINHR